MSLFESTNEGSVTNARRGLRPARVAMAVAVLSVLGYVGCTKVFLGPSDTGSGVVGIPASASAVGGTGQSGIVGQAVGTPPSVRVLSADGRPVKDIVVTFGVVGNGGASVVGGAPRTDANGVAAVGQWTLGTIAGLQTLTASVPGVTTVTFSVTARADVAVSIKFASIDTLVLMAGASEALPLVATDKYGNSTASGITYTVASGSSVLSVSPAGLVTGTAPGNATVIASAGPVSASKPVSVIAASTSRALVPARPYGISVAASGAVYVSQLDGQSVTRLSLSPLATTGTVTVGATPTDVAFDPSGALAVVANQFDPSAGIIDVATGKQVKSISAFSTTFRALVAPDGKRAYVTSSGGQLLVIDLAARTLITMIPIVGAANGIALAPGDSIMYVTGMFGGISVVNVLSNTVTRTIALPGALQDVVVAPDGASLYVAREDALGIDVIAVSTGAVTSRIALAAPVFGLKLASDGRTLFATHPSAGLVSVVDRITGVVARSVKVGGSPRRIAFDPKTGRAVVSNEAGWVDYILP